MLVRDRTAAKTDYKGQATGACETACPCRWCYEPHDCGNTHSYYGHQIDMQCLNRYRRGCPSPKPEPEHVWSSDRGRVCRRCGARR